MPTLQHRFAALLGKRIPLGDTSRTQMEQGIPTTGAQHNCWRGTATQTSSPSSSSSYHLPRPELPNNSFTALNLNPILCSKKQQRKPPEASATGQNSSLASQTSSTPLQLSASLQSVCKACHESNQSLFHKLGLHTAAQCQGQRKGCPPAFPSNKSSDVHTGMGNSRGIQLLGWFSYTFPFSLADGCPEG